MLQGMEQWCSCPSHLQSRDRRKRATMIAKSECYLSTRAKYRSGATLSGSMTVRSRNA